MYPVVKWLASGGTLLLLNASLAPALASDASLNLLVVAEGGAVSNFQLGQMDHVARMVMTELTERGHTVFDDTIIPGYGAPRANPASAAAMAKLTSRALSVPLDAVISVSANVSLKTGAYVSRLEVRAKARLVDGRTGQHIALIALAPSRSQRVPGTCRQGCLRDLAAKLVEARSSHLGAEIARRLAKRSRAHPSPPIPKVPETTPASVGYELNFRGIDARDLTEIEEYLAVFRGYRGFDRSKSGAVYSYRSDLNQPELERSLRKMLRLMGIGARITRTGRSIVIDAAGTQARPPATSKDW
ncbi:MAG: hypothetical protein V3T02_02125 [Alphaproteobacteria bacterium]